MALTKKGFCQENNLDENKVFEMIVGPRNEVFPVKSMCCFMTLIGEDRITCINDKQGIKKDILFSSFQKAEFGIGSGQLWLQCEIDGKFMAFCTNRKAWKSEAAKLLLEKIGANTPILDTKEYERYTGPFFLFYALIR